MEPSIKLPKTGLTNKYIGATALSTDLLNHNHPDESDDTDPETLITFSFGGEKIEEHLTLFN